MQFIYVFIGGGLGAMCRFGIGQWITNSENGFPLPTLIANLASSFILGLLIGYSINQNLHTNYKLLLMTGFCGGFSTFSTFSAETYQLLVNGDTGLSFLYVTSSVLVCVSAVWAGIIISKMLFVAN